MVRKASFLVARYKVYLTFNYERFESIKFSAIFCGNPTRDATS